MNSIQTRHDRYNELKSIYKISRSTYHLIPQHLRATMSPEEKQAYADKASEEYDIIIECVGTGYGHKKYRVAKNAPGLSAEDLAIICDQGNLCFGYRTEGKIICVHTD